jgi:hypothetical protein
MDKEKLEKLVLKKVNKDLKKSGPFCDECWWRYAKITKALKKYIQVPDPFQEEINNEIVIKDWCEDCYEESLYDI